LIHHFKMPIQIFALIIISLDLFLIINSPKYFLDIALYSTVILLFLLEIFLKSIKVDEKGIDLVYAVGQKVLFTKKRISWERIKALGAKRKALQQWNLYVFAKENEKYLLCFNSGISNSGQIVDLVLKRIPNIDLQWDAKEYLHEKGLDA
jgi:hypothetical protein